MKYRHFNYSKVKIFIVEEVNVEPVRLLLEYKDYTNIFFKEDAVNLPNGICITHAINIYKGLQVPYNPIYNLLKKELRVLYKYLINSLVKG